MNVTKEEVEKAKAAYEAADAEAAAAVAAAYDVAAIAAAWAVEKAEAAWDKFIELKREYKKGNYRVSGKLGV